jgi:hypothetical protein
VGRDTIDLFSINGEATMKCWLSRYIITLLLLIAPLVSHASSRVDPMLTLMESAPVSASKGVSNEIGGQLLDVVIKSSAPDEIRTAIHLEGGAVHSIIGDIMTAEVPPAAIASLAELPSVEYVEAAKHWRGRPL